MPVTVGPPTGVSTEDCSPAMATFERLQSGQLNGWPVYHVYAQFTEAELDQLKHGTLCISFYSDVMPMHSVEIVSD